MAKTFARIVPVLLMLGVMAALAVADEIPRDKMDLPMITCPIAFTLNLIIANVNET